MSLFSYLDGLVCTMGALILLLLMTTYRIRQQVVAEFAEKSRPAAAAPQSPPESLPLPSNVDELALRQREIDLKQQEHAQAVAKHESTLKARHAAWQAKLDQFAETNQTLSSQVAQTRLQVEDQNASLSRLQSERDRLAGLMSSARKHAVEVNGTERELQQQAEDLLRLRETCLKKIDAAKVQQALRNPVFEIVAHDGNSGTDRRPILIECTAESLIFASEKIRLSAATLNEFTPDVNPLLAGTEALMTYWTLVDSREHPGKPGPYVLMIVRPGGTVAFYVARKFLERMNQEFGYELVTANAEFKYPPPDPQAVEVCQRAIDRVLHGDRPLQFPGNSGFGSGNGNEPGISPQRRGQPSGNSALGSGLPAERTGAPGGGHEQIVGSDGAFSLPEVEQLRNATPSDSIGMLGPEWSHSRQSGRQSDRTRQSTPPSGRTMPQTDDQAGTPEQRLTPNGVTNSGAAPGALEKYREELAGKAGSENARRSEQPIDSNLSGQPQAEGEPGSSHPFSSQADADAEFSQAISGRNRLRNSAGGRPPEMAPPPNFNGARSLATEGMSGSGSDSASAMPPGSFQSMSSRSNSFRNDGGEKKRWGHSQPSGMIGIERTISFHLRSDRMSIDDGPESGIPVEMTRPEFQEIVAAMIEVHAQTWGDPPPKFFWRPALKVIIHPGGNQHYPRLKELLDHWGLSGKVEHVLD